MASLPPIDPAPVGVPKLAGSDQNGIIDGADRENAERTEPQDPGPDLADVEAMGAHPAQHDAKQESREAAVPGGIRDSGLGGRGKRPIGLPATAVAVAVTSYNQKLWISL